MQVKVKWWNIQIQPWHDLDCKDDISKQIYVWHNIWHTCTCVSVCFCLQAWLHLHISSQGELVKRIVLCSLSAFTCLNVLRYMPWPSVVGLLLLNLINTCISAQCKARASTFLSLYWNFIRLPLCRSTLCHHLKVKKIFCNDPGARDDSWQPVCVSPATCAWACVLQPWYLVSECS